MPTRILNLPVFVFVPLVVATLVRPGAPGFGLAVAAALGAIALLWQRAHGLQSFGVPLVGFAALAIAALPGLPPAVPSRARRGAGIAIALLLAAGIGSVVLWSARSLPRRLALNVADRSSDAALAAASRRPGLLAVAPGVERPQQMTRRPIVIDPQALDMVTYAPAALPAMVRAIEDLYGIPFESPRPEYRNLSMLPAAPVKEIWERRSAAEWAVDRRGVRRDGRAGAGVVADPASGTRAISRVRAPLDHGTSRIFPVTRPVWESACACSASSSRKRCATFTVTWPAATARTTSSRRVRFGRPSTAFDVKGGSNGWIAVPSESPDTMTCRPPGPSSERQPAPA